MHSGLCNLKKCLVVQAAVVLHRIKILLYNNSSYNKPDFFGFDILRCIFPALPNIKFIYQMRVWWQLTLNKDLNELIIYGLIGNISLLH